MHTTYKMYVPRNRHQQEPLEIMPAALKTNMAYMKQQQQKSEKMPTVFVSHMPYRKEKHAKTLTLVQNPALTIMHCQSCHNIRKQRKIEESLNSFSLQDIALPAINRFLRPGYSYFRKLVWGLLCLAIVVVCVWQLYDRITFYFTYPTMLDISVARLEEVTMPAVTLCPAQNPLEKSSRYHRDENLFDLDDAWKEFSLDDYILVTVACQPNDVDCEENKGKVLPSFKNLSVLTILGRCLIVQIDSAMEYRGTQTWLTIEVQDRKGGGDENLTAYYMVHPHDTIPRHQVYFETENLLPGQVQTLRLAVKQFSHVSTSVKPCGSAASVSECKDSCLDKKMMEVLAKESHQCRLPITPSLKLPACSSVESAADAFDEAVNMYLSHRKSECQCQRPCDETLYVVTTYHQNHNEPDSSMLLLQFENNIVETFTEKHAYSFPALLSDIGGSLGFFLGFCIFTVIELLECIVDSVLSSITSFGFNGRFR